MRYEPRSLLGMSLMAKVSNSDSDLEQNAKLHKHTHGRIGGKSVSTIYFFWSVSGLWWFPNLSLSTPLPLLSVSSSILSFLPPYPVHARIT